jgi:hypothetical protein
MSIAVAAHTTASVQRWVGVIGLAGTFIGGLHGSESTAHGRGPTVWQSFLETTSAVAESGHLSLEWPRRAMRRRPLAAEHAAYDH